MKSYLKNEPVLNDITHYTSTIVLYIFAQFLNYEVLKFYFNINKIRSYENIYV